MKKPLAIFDIDGTIFRSSLLIELNWKLIKEGIFPSVVKSRLDKHYFSWIDRRGSYGDYINEVVQIYDKHIKGCKAADIKRLSCFVIQEQKDRVYVYTRDLIKKLRKSHLLAAVSGSPIEIVGEFNRYWKFDYILATKREVKNGIYTGKGKRTPAVDKKSVLLELVKNEGLDFVNSIGVGDTESDIGIFELVEEPICFNPNKNLYEIAKSRGWKIVVERKDVIFIV